MYNINYKIFASSLSSLILILWMAACSEDKISEPSDDPQTNYENLTTVELPGYLSVSLGGLSGYGTRADDNTFDESSDGTLDDGNENEYLFAPGNHHYVIVYRQGKDNQVPEVIIPLTFQGDYCQMEEAGNITLSAKKIVVKEDMTPALGGLVISELLNNGEVYVLANFESKLIYKINNYPKMSLNKSDVENLFTLTRAQFLSLPLADYKIKVNGTDYFTMSNSVYLDAKNDAKIDFTINKDLKGDPLLYDTEDEARVSGVPTIEVHLERLAVKYSVAFGQNPTQTYDSETSLPVYHITINEYDGYEPSSEGYTIKSKTAQASVRVLGYYLNNTEKSSYAIKKISSSATKALLSQNYWNEPGNYRSYWSEDPDYLLKNYLSGNLKNAAGYPHQFRQALETDTVLQMHGVDKDSKKGYTWESDPEVTVVRKVIVRDENGYPVTDEEGKPKYEDRAVSYYKDLGRPDNTSFNEECVLNYRSFNEMIDSYNTIKGIEGQPMYSLENTFYDPGMTVAGNEYGSWVWRWQKASYSAATNLTVLCELVTTSTVGTLAETVYRGQNNIFYYSLDEGDDCLLQSKLNIFNQIILSQGNAGINILHAYFASHGFLDTGEDTFHGSNLEKVGWNRNSVLWIGYVENDGTEISHREVTKDDLRLIPAEISGGDGQCLIAPKEMGPNVKFYLAPVNLNADGKPISYDGQLIPENEPQNFVRNISQSVEISFNHLVALIHKSIGPIDVFYEGKMYYSVPIPHNVKSLQMTGDAPSWQTLGNIGVVRNNWYNITVTNIGDVGTPVHDPTQPIVPVMDVKRSYINANVQVYGWHTISQGDIPMQ